ncbi:MAG: outer membrane beta-barrel protein [Alistipes sp.]|nr:outer membrane beta-barrel protein [Alistipes sp.]
MAGYVRHIMAFVAVALLSGAGARAMAQEYPNPFMPYGHKQGKVKTEWGAGIGGVYTGFGRISSDAVRLNTRLGIQGHLDMGVVIGRYLGVESKIIFEKGGIDAEYRGKVYDITTTAFEMPLLLSLRLWDGAIRANAGVQFGLISNGGYLDGRESYMFGTVTPTWNFASGVGIRLRPNVLVELRYTHALQDGANQLGAGAKGAGLDFTTRTHKVMLGVSLIL